MYNIHFVSPGTPKTISQGCQHKEQSIWSNGQAPFKLKALYIMSLGIHVKTLSQLQFDYCCG